ncbi:hypothetical protein DL98DRAFT_637866 [Cadophora sp. DSE1049]|nr:hypothetical protein DL98DRAFT_637866 [Cadophora sp. DSE1049]
MHAMRNATFLRLLPSQSCVCLVWVGFIRDSLVLFSLAGLLCHVRHPSSGLLHHGAIFLGLVHHRHLLRRCNALVQLLAPSPLVPSVDVVLLLALLGLSRPLPWAWGGQSASEDGRSCRSSHLDRTQLDRIHRGSCEHGVVSILVQGGKILFRSGGKVGASRMGRDVDISIHL